MAKDAPDDPLRNYAYGDLNPLVKKKGRVYRDNETDSIEVLKDIAANEFQSETVLGTGPYKAICLRVESAAAGGTGGVTAIPELSWLDRLYETFGGQPKPDFISVKAFIPELHGSWLPTPKDYNDNNKINKYPTFVARQSGTGESPPKPGDIVWVDFGNRLTLSDPQYLGKLESDIGQKLEQAMAGAAFNCGGGLNMSSPPGDNVAVSNEPVGKIGPRKAPDYVPININKDRGKIPQGKGLFTGASLNPIKLSRFPVEKAVEAGISWVSIYVYKIKQNGKTRTIDRDSLKTFIDAYHKKGIRCYIYGWAAIGLGSSYNANAFKAKHNGQEPEDLFVKNMIDLAVYTGAFGVEIDAEEDMYARGTGIKLANGKWGYSPDVVKRNEDFARKLKQACKRHNLTLGFTSTTPNKNSPKKGHHYASWAKYCDYAVPQVYSASGFWGKNHWSKGYNRYAAEGFKKIIPGLGAYDVGKKGATKTTKTVERMRWELHACYGQNLGWHDAVIWWAWKFLDHHNRWSVVKELGSGGTGTSDQVADNLNAGTDTATTSNAAGETTTAPVDFVGPPAAPPVTEQKTKSAEVIKDKKPGAFAKYALKTITDIKKNKASKYQGKEIEIRRQELFAFTDEKGEEIDRLLSVAGPNASTTPAEIDQQKYEQLVNTAKNNIQEALKSNSDVAFNAKIIEQEIIGLKKQLKLIDNTGTTTPEMADLKRKISERESRLKDINKNMRNKQTASSATNNNCRSRGGSFSSGPAGAAIPLSKFAGGNYPALLKDDISVKLPSRKRRTGVNQIMIHQSGVHTVAATVKILAKKDLSVHYTVSLDGKVRQHVPLDEVSFHAAIAPGEQNTRTIGIEMVNRYIPDKAKYSIGNQPILDNCIFTRGYGKGSSGKILSPSAYRGTAGRVRMPTQAACEAAWQLCKWLPTQINTLKLAFPGLTSKGFLWAGGNSYHPEKRYDDGITSHARSIATRSDGVFTEHYMVCRSLGHSPDSAFKRTIAAATSREPGMKGNKHYTNYHKGNTYTAKYFAWKGRNVKTFDEA